MICDAAQRTFSGERTEGKEGGGAGETGARLAKSAYLLIVEIIIKFIDMTFAEET